MSAEMILVVDDDELFAQTLSRSLERRGFDTCIAIDEASALAMADKHAPDRAVIDLKIGQESGLTLLTELGKRLPDLRMIILTGYSSIATAVAAMQLGAINYVCKPADADEILAAFDAEGSQAEQTELPDNPPSVKRLQWEHVQKVLKENNGNISVTARALGMHRRTLQRILQKKPVKR